MRTNTLVPRLAVNGSMLNVSIDITADRCRDRIALAPIGITAMIGSSRTGSVR